MQCANLRRTSAGAYLDFAVELDKLYTYTASRYDKEEDIGFQKDTYCIQFSGTVSSYRLMIFIKSTLFYLFIKEFEQIFHIKVLLFY